MKTNRADSPRAFSFRTVLQNAKQFGRGRKKSMISSVFKMIASIISPSEFFVKSFAEQTYIIFFPDSSIFDLRVRTPPFAHTSIMCGRYYFGLNHRGAQKIAEQLPKNEQYVQLRFGDIFPKNIAPVFTANSERPILLRWGFERFDQKGVLINARAETVTEKQTFRKGFLERRCVIPACGFYEWDENKVKIYFEPKNKRLLYRCGFTKRFDGEERFIVLTKPATPPVARFHNRIPVIADENTIEKYLTDMRFASEFVTQDNTVVLKNI